MKLWKIAGTGLLSIGLIIGAAWGQEYRPDQAVEVREGDTWSSATVVKKEGRRYQIRYDDGTEEWVTTDRIRQPGAAVDEKKEDAQADTSKPAPKPAPKAPAEVFKIGQKVEAKRGGSWSGAKIKNRDGDLYLIILDGWEHQMHWAWAHVSGIRAVGSNKPGPQFAHTVSVGRDVQKAKEEARRRFANVEKEMEAEASGRGRRGAFDPVPYDKTITTPDVSAAKELMARGELKGFVPDVADGGGKWEAASLRGGSERGMEIHLDLAATIGMVVHGKKWGTEYQKIEVEVVNLRTGTSLGVVDWELLGAPQSISPSGKRVIARQVGFHNGTMKRVDIFELAGSPLKANHLVSFEPYLGADEHQRDVKLAMLIDDTRALTVGASGEIVMWEVAAGSARGLWRVYASKSSAVALSPNRKQLACMTNNGLAIVDLEKGAVLGVLGDQRHVNSMTFSADGRGVIAVTGNVLSNWDLIEGEVLQDIGLPQGVQNASVTAVEPGFVLLNGRYLMDLSKRVVIWDYTGAGRETVGHAGRAWAVIANGQRSALIPAELPHAAARKAAAELTVEEGLQLRPGMKVSLEMSLAGTPEQLEAARTAITEQLKASGITVEPGQPVKIVARTEDGKTTERTYETMGGAPWNRERETVSVTEKITRIYVESEGKIAWENRSVSTPPYMLHRKEGQSIGQAAAASNQYNLAFLNSVRVPAYVPKVREKLGLGTSGFAQ